MTQDSTAGGGAELGSLSLAPGPSPNTFCVGDPDFGRTNDRELVLGEERQLSPAGGWSLVSIPSAFPFVCVTHEWRADGDSLVR